LLAARIITAVLFGAVITGSVLLLPARAAAGVFALLWILGAWEWAGFARFAGAPRWLYTAIMAACFVVLEWFAEPRAVQWMLPLALAWWALALVAVLSFPRPLGPRLVAVAGFIVLVPSWALLADLLGAGGPGPALAFTLLCVIWGADVGAYVFGRLLGRHKLAPAVSPGKTWEGVTGGLLVTALVAALAASWLQLPHGRMVALGLGTAVVSVLGDLTQSMFKRNVGLKDSGTLLPGHGGVLDRIDSLTAAVPAFIVGLKLLGLPAP
jgi:phosphatidate cytidylyltransferase